MTLAGTTRGIIFPWNFVVYFIKKHEVSMSLLTNSNIINFWDSVMNSNQLALEQVKSAEVIKLLSDKPIDLTLSDEDIYLSRYYVLSYYLTEGPLNKNYFTKLVHGFSSLSNEFGFKGEHLGYALQSLLDQYHEIGDASARLNYLLTNFGKDIILSPDQLLGVVKVLIAIFLEVGGDFIQEQGILNFLQYNNDIQDKISSGDNEDYLAASFANLKHYFKYKDISKISSDENFVEAETAFDQLKNEYKTDKDKVDKVYGLLGGVVDSDAENVLLNFVEQAKKVENEAGASQNSSSILKGSIQMLTPEQTAGHKNDDTVSSSPEATVIPDESAAKQNDTTQPQVSQEVAPSEVKIVEIAFPESLEEYHQLYNKLLSEGNSNMLIKFFNDFLENKGENNRDSGAGKTSPLKNMADSFRAEKENIKSNLQDTESHDKALLELRTLVVEAFCLVSDKVCDVKKSIYPAKNCIVTAKDAEDLQFRYSLKSENIADKSKCLVDKAIFKLGRFVNTNNCENSSDFFAKNISNIDGVSAENIKFPVTDAVHFLMDFYIQVGGQCSDITE
jgi:hypothetical protein